MSFKKRRDWAVASSVSPPSSLLRGSVDGQLVVMARSFWVSDRGDENFGGSCAEIPKLLTGRSLNSCVDCKISISVTSKALEIFRVI